MMEIWIRSIARAGGVEMPPETRVLKRQSRTPRWLLRADLAQFLRQTAGWLVRMAERVEHPSPSRAAPCG